ncbi:kinase-like protein [Xylaria bambusicola]|uniref:kinase-like protein n=1 Tax=Xylaria bambusicola TaxID=326684 RepID=UPI0020085A7A|nr:kinase-like protein [Xylaria bambusicola]KAI0506168.1 kinase-like protein [Xylaria bambusicola]
MRNILGIAACLLKHMVYKVDLKTVVKSSKDIRLSEAEPMRDEESSHTRIIIEFIKGVELDEAWDTYSATEKESVIAQLRVYMEELSQLKGTFIGSIDASWCVEDDFNASIVKALKEGKTHAHVDVKLTCDIFLEIMKGHKIGFTHNDFAPRNILIGWIQERALDKILQPRLIELSVM